MTIPLPEPDTHIPCNTGEKKVNVPVFVSETVRAYGDAVRAEEREWWREIAEQLIACHDEPTCPAVRLAQERLDGR